MAHDSKRGEKVAGLFHLGFAALYLAALVWHTKAALEHFKRVSVRESEAGKVGLPDPSKFYELL